jgi:hypothetical protein
MTKNSKRTAGVTVRRVKFKSRADLLIHLHELLTSRKRRNSNPSHRPHSKMSAEATVRRYRESVCPGGFEDAPSASEKRSDGKEWS